MRFFFRPTSRRDLEGMIVLGWGELSQIAQDFGSVLVFGQYVECFPVPRTVRKCLSYYFCHPGHKFCPSNWQFCGGMFGQFFICPDSSLQMCGSCVCSLLLASSNQGHSHILHPINKHHLGAHLDQPGSCEPLGYTIDILTYTHS